MATIFQKLAVDHVSIHNDAAPLQYDRLKAAKFEAVYFRPEEGVDLVSQRIAFANKQDTFRGKFDGNVWYADPLSADSAAAGIPSGPQTWADHIVSFVKSLRARGTPPRIVKLNVEFTGKGYPPFKAMAEVKPWMKCYLKFGGKAYLYFTPNGGKNGDLPNVSFETQTFKSGSVVWQREGGSAEYQYANGWNWNELAATRLFTLLPDQPFIVQPMSLQADFNHAAWMRPRAGLKFGPARNSPQCYGDQPYLGLTDPGLEISSIADNPYAMAYYNVKLDRRMIHPTIGAYGKGSFYVPKLKKAREKGPFGFVIYRHDAFKESDWTDYGQFAVA